MRKRTLEIMDAVEAAGWVDGKPTFTPEIIKKIKEAAVVARKKPIYETVQKMDPGWMKTETPENLYIDMCLKIAQAPTRIHMMATATILIPHIADALEREGR